MITGAIGLQGMRVPLAGRIMIAAARNALIQNVSIGIGIVDDPAVQSTDEGADVAALTYLLDLCVSLIDEKDTPLHGDVRSM